MKTESTQKVIQYITSLPGTGKTHKLINTVAVNINYYYIIAVPSMILMDQYLSEFKKREVKCVFCVKSTTNDRVLDTLSQALNRPTFAVESKVAAPLRPRVILITHSCLKKLSPTDKNLQNLSKYNLIVDEVFDIGNGNPKDRYEGRDCSGGRVYDLGQFFTGKLYSQLIKAEDLFIDEFKRLTINVKAFKEYLCLKQSSHKVSISLEETRKFFTSISRDTNYTVYRPLKSDDGSNSKCIVMTFFNPEILKRFKSVLISSACFRYSDLAYFLQLPMFGFTLKNVTDSYTNPKRVAAVHRRYSDLILYPIFHDSDVITLFKSKKCSEYKKECDIEEESPKIRYSKYVRNEKIKFVHQKDYNLEYIRKDLHDQDILLDYCDYANVIVGSHSAFSHALRVVNYDDHTYGATRKRKVLKGKLIPAVSHGCNHYLKHTAMIHVACFNRKPEISQFLNDFLADATLYDDPDYIKNEENGIKDPRQYCVWRSHNVLNTLQALGRTNLRDCNSTNKVRVVVSSESMVISIQEALNSNGEHNWPKNGTSYVIPPIKTTVKSLNLPYKVIYFDAKTLRTHVNFIIKSIRKARILRNETKARIEKIKNTELLHLQKKLLSIIKSIVDYSQHDQYKAVDIPLERYDSETVLEHYAFVQKLWKLYHETFAVSKDAKVKIHKQKATESEDNKIKKQEARDRIVYWCNRIDSEAKKSGESVTKVAHSYGSRGTGDLTTQDFKYISKYRTSKNKV